ncbi:MAG: hypothetical protein ACYCPT_01740 [Acidimicrobiales bacterium]
MLSSLTTIVATAWSRVTMASFGIFTVYQYLMELGTLKLGPACVQSVQLGTWATINS